MRREIKFRAWDKIKKLIIPVVAPMPLGGVLVPAGESKVGIMGAYQKNYNYLSSERVELMQFTGLLDKNGKEIYEGDKGFDINDDFYEVKFDEGKFIAVMNGDVIVDLSEVAEDVEVIGNIYENSELNKHN